MAIGSTQEEVGQTRGEHANVTLKGPWTDEASDLVEGDKQRDCYLFHLAFLQNSNFPALCRNIKGVTKELREVTHIPIYTTTQCKSSGAMIKINKIKFQQILKHNIHREVMMMIEALCFARSFPSLLCLPGMGRTRMQRTERLQKEAIPMTKMWSKTAVMNLIQSKLFLKCKEAKHTQCWCFL